MLMRLTLFYVFLVLLVSSTFAYPLMPRGESTHTSSTTSDPGLHITGDGHTEGSESLPMHATSFPKSPRLTAADLNSEKDTNPHRAPFPHGPLPVAPHARYVRRQYSVINPVSTEHNGADPGPPPPYSPSSPNPDPSSSRRPDSPYLDTFHPSSRSPSPPPSSRHHDSPYPAPPPPYSHSSPNPDPPSSRHPDSPYPDTFSSSSRIPTPSSRHDTFHDSSSRSPSPPSSPGLHTFYDSRTSPPSSPGLHTFYNSSPRSLSPPPPSRQI